MNPTKHFTISSKLVDNNYVYMLSLYNKANQDDTPHDILEFANLYLLVRYVQDNLGGQDDAID